MVSEPSAFFFMLIAGSYEETSAEKDWEDGVCGGDDHSHDGVGGIFGRDGEREQREKWCCRIMCGRRRPCWW
jgi:hypothetical protein